MIRRTVIGFASAVALFGATACDSENSGTNGNDKMDAATDGGGRPDSGEDLDDASTGPDGDAGTDAATDPMDAAAHPMDADVENDAATEDAGSDAAQTEADAGTDAGEDAGSDASTEPELPALAAWYKFDENTGTSTADSTGTFAAGVLENGATWTAGVHGSALDLAGGPGNEDHPYASLPADILEGCDDVTIALWMKLGSADQFWARLLEIDGLVDGFTYFTATELFEGKPHLRFTIVQGVDHIVRAPYPEGTTLVDVWHHVAFTLSGGTGRLYFDGVETGSGPMAKKPSDLTMGAGAHARLGRSIFDVDPYLDGSIDDLRISCTAYTAEQIAALAK